jgi:hypothetical protein
MERWCRAAAWKPKAGSGQGSIIRYCNDLFHCRS